MYTYEKIGARLMLSPTDGRTKLNASDASIYRTVSITDRSIQFNPINKNAVVIEDGVLGGDEI